MFRRANRAVWLRWTIVSATAGAVTLAGVSATAAGGDTAVDCRSNSSALQAAIAAAAPGAKLTVQGTCTGPFTIGKALTLIGRKQAVLDGNHTGTTVTISAAVQVRLTRLTITGGQGGQGGGIRNSGGTLTVTHSTVTGNSSTGPGGGGIYNESGTVTVEDSTLAKNTSTGTGGGIRNQGTLTVKSTSVHHNTAQTLGGGIDNVSPSTMMVSRSKVHHNTVNTVNGGGIFNDGTATVDYSEVSDNTSPVGSGGGIRVTGANGRLTLNHTLVRHNTTAATGGGVSVGANAVATLNDSKVRNNTASNGGGVNVDPGGTATLNRTRVTDNTPNNCAPTGAVPGCIG